MRIYIWIVVLVGISVWGKAMNGGGQLRPFGENFHFQKIGCDEDAWKTCFGAEVSQIEGKIFDSHGFENSRSTGIFWLGVKLSPTLTKFDGMFVPFYTKEIRSYTISDTSSAEVIAVGITSKNVNEFRYHVIENDSVEIVPWSVPSLEQKHGASQPYAYLGTYRAFNKQILVEIVNTKRYYRNARVILDWQKDNFPQIKEIEIRSGYKIRNGAPIYEQYGRIKIHANGKVESWGISKSYKVSYDPITKLPSHFVFPFDSVDQIKFYFKKQIIFSGVLKDFSGPDSEICKDARIYTCIGDDNTCSFEVPHVAGKHNLFFLRDDFYGQKTLPKYYKLEIDILPPSPLHIRYALRQILWYMCLMILVLLTLFGIYYFYNRRRLLKAKQAQENIHLRLKAIRSQLNPHFMFNALSSIQGLMNKSDIEQANHYLARFSSLTRKVLDTSAQDRISLADELNILSDYLLMEQLRFGFAFDITVDESINQPNVEIPAMLLQPFVENAVKHGVALLHEKGHIQVSVSQLHHHLQLSVTDNGNGFDVANTETTGLGLKLCNDRIALLNQTNMDNLVLLAIKSDTNGTLVTVTLENWL